MRSSESEYPNSISEKKLINDKWMKFFQSVLDEIHKTGAEVPVLASFIQRGWEKGFHDSWMYLLAEYNSLEKEIIWKQAFQSNSDTKIIDAWIKYGSPLQITTEQERLLHSAISRFGALAQIKQARNNKSGENSQDIEQMVGPLLDGSDLIFKGKNKK